MHFKGVIRLVLVVMCFGVFTQVHAQNFIVGSIITNVGDTLVVRVVVSKNKKENYRNQFTAVSIVDLSGQVVSFRPHEIRGYTVGKSTFRSLHSRTFSFFMEEKVGGDLQVYYYPGFDMEGGDKYIFKKSNEREFNVMNAAFNVEKLSSFSAGTNPEANAVTRNSVIPIVDHERVFIEFFSSYFHDCPFISRKITTRFYSSSDFIDICKDYNSECHKRS